METDNYYFSPSVLRGNPGQQIRVLLSNDSKSAHNLSMESQQINTDVPVGGKDIAVTLTFPVSGTISFRCEYHGSLGMVGGLNTSGDPAAGGGATPAPSPTSGGYNY